MIDIRPLQQITPEVTAVVTGSYTCTYIYRVRYSDSPERTCLETRTTQNGTWPFS